MPASFFIDFDTGASHEKLLQMHKDFEAGKISSAQFAAALEAAAAADAKLQKANDLASMSLAKIGSNITHATTLLDAYVAKTREVEQSLRKLHTYGSAGNIKDALSDRAAVEAYNAQLKQSIQLKGQLKALSDADYAAIMKENMALKEQVAARTHLLAMEVKGEKTVAINRSGLSTELRNQELIQAGLASAMRTTASESERVASAARSGSQAFTAYGSAIRGVAGSLGALWMSYGQVLPLMAAFAGAQVIKSAVNLSSEFEYTAEYVATLGRYAGQSVRSVVELREELLNVGETRHSINELAGGIREFSKAGVDVTTSLRDIGEMSRFASLAEMDLVDATKLVIGQANAFGVSYADAANMIASAAMSSATDIGEMATAMSYTTELGSVAKVELSEVAAAMGVLANNGIRGSKAGTALRTSILRMQNPTEKVSKMLAEMNVQWDAFTDDGKVKSIQGMFTELARAMKEAHLTESQMSELQYELFGLRSLKGGANLLKDITTGFVDMHESVNRSTEGVTFLSQATGDLVETNVVKLDKLKAAYSNFLTEFLEGNETVGRLYDSMRGLVDGSLFDRPPSDERPLINLSGWTPQQTHRAPEGFNLQLAPSMVDPFANMPAFRPYMGINAGTELSIREGLYKPTEKSIEEARKLGESYREAEKALEDIDQRLEGYSHKGASTLFEKMEKDVSAANIQFDKMLEGFSGKHEKGDINADDMAELTKRINEAKAAARAFFQEEYDAKSLEAIEAVADKFEKFKLNSERVGLSDFERGISKIREESTKSISELDALYKKVLQPDLSDDQRAAAIDEIHKKLGVTRQEVLDFYEAQEKTFRSDSVKEYADKISDLRDEYTVLSKSQRAVQAVNEKFDDAIDDVNKKFGEGSVEANRFTNELNNIRAMALTTDKAILRASDSIRNGFVAALRDASEEMMTFGELGSSIGESLIGGLKESLTDMIVELDTGNFNDIWEGVWADLSRTGASFVADQVVGTAAGWLSDLIGVDLGGNAPTGAAGDAFHVIVDNMAAGALGGFGGEDGGWWGEAEKGTGVMGWLSETFGSEVASWLGKVGGAIGVAGGAYGVYSGAREISDGNIGAGALQMGVGAASMYKGAVALNLIDEGTATAIGKSIATEVGSWFGETATNVATDAAVEAASRTASTYVSTGADLAMEGSYAPSTSAGSGAALGGGASLLSGVAPFAGMVLMQAFKAAWGPDYSYEQRTRDRLNAAGTGEGDLRSAGVGELLSVLSRSLTNEFAPALDTAAVASYNAADGTLVLGRTQQEWVRQGADGQGVMIEAMKYTVTQLDKLTGAWVTTDVPIDTMIEQLRELAPATDAAAAAAAQMIATQAGFPSLADEVLMAYNDYSYGARLAANETGVFSGMLGELSGQTSRASEIAQSLSGSINGVSASGVVAGDRLSSLSGGLSSVAAQSGRASSGMLSQAAAANSLASASATAASRISAAASDIGGAVSRIGGMLNRAATYSIPNADGAVYQYHARGGIMEQPVVFHVGGEAGSEAILPLHNGPQTLQFIDKKIDALLNGSGIGNDDLKAILVAVAVNTKRTSDMLRKFEYVGIPVAKREAVA